MGLIQDLIIRAEILGILLGQNSPGRIKMFGVMGMRIVRIQCLDHVTSRFGNKHLILAEHGLKFFTCKNGIKDIAAPVPAAKISSVMNKAEIVAV